MISNYSLELHITFLQIEKDVQIYVAVDMSKVSYKLNVGMDGHVTQLPEQLAPQMQCKYQIRRKWVICHVNARRL